MRKRAMMSAAVSNPQKPTHVAEFYKDRKGEMRWRIRHRNGNIIADSGEGYRRVADAARALDRLAHAFRGFRVDGVRLIPAVLTRAMKEAGVRVVRRGKRA